MRSESLFIVDDDLNHLERVSQYLTKEGFKVSTGSNLKETLKHLLVEEHDLILIKHHMPYYDGLTLMRRLQKEGAKSSFIIMSESLDVKQAIAIMQEGAHSILTMPYRMEQLKIMARNGIQNKNAFLEILQLSDNLSAANNELQEKKAALEEEQSLLKNKIEELNFLNELSCLMSSSLNPETVIDDLAKNLKDRVFFDIFSVMTLGDKDIFLKIHSHDPLEKEMLNDINRNIHKSFKKYVGNSISFGAQSKIMPGNGDKVLNIPNGHELDYKLQVADKKLGVLKVIRYANEPFSNDQKKLLSTVANQLSLSLNNAMKHKKYLSLAAYDFLTNTLNRRTFDEIIDREFNRSMRYKLPLSLVMLDLDHFKNLNDEWGHQAGDTVLKEVSDIVSHCLREADILARYGGEEFVMILPQTDIEKAGILTERIRKTIESKPIKVEKGIIHVTISFGIAAYPYSKIEDKNELIRFADNALYEAKRKGRNCVCIYTSDNNFCEIKVADKKAEDKTNNKRKIVNIK